MVFAYNVPREPCENGRAGTRELHPIFDQCYETTSSARVERCAKERSAEGLREASKPHAEGLGEPVSGLSLRCQVRDVVLSSWGVRI
jgi:hypothetical protein